MYLSASELCSQSQWLITMVVNLYPNQSPICVIIMGYQDQSQQRSHHLVTVPSGASLGGGGVWMEQSKRGRVSLFSQPFFQIWEIQGD